MVAFPNSKTSSPKEKRRTALAIISTSLIMTFFGSFLQIPPAAATAATTNIQSVEGTGTGDIICGGVAPGQDIEFSATKERDEIIGTFTTSPSIVQGDITKLSVSADSFRLSGVLTQVRACGDQEAAKFTVTGECGQHVQALFESKSGIKIDIYDVDVICSK